MFDGESALAAIEAAAIEDGYSLTQDGRPCWRLDGDELPIAMMLDLQGLVFMAKVTLGAVQRNPELYRADMAASFEIGMREHARAFTALLARTQAEARADQYARGAEEAGERA